MKKVRRTTRLFRYDLSEILHDFTVEEINTFKGLYLVVRVPEELCMEFHKNVQDTVTKTISKKKKFKKKNSCMRRHYTYLRKEEM